MGRLNILVSGGTGGGKTTLLNVLCSFIPKKERIVTIEDTPELVVSHANSVRMQTKPQTPTSPAVGARDLVANALRMRPDRIIVGECRKSEAFDMLQAMNTGHSGSMTTLHANSSRDALSRLETLCMLAGTDLPIAAIRKQIASALDLVVQIKRFRDGKRRVIEVAELTGMEGETILLQDIFSYETRVDASGHTEKGRFKVTGLVPTFIDRLRENGLDFPQNYFG
ncbi:MAG: CpaF family protein [Bdellovibrio sp.]|nr:CpaF family protein [Bdellovibrio sp.]